VAWSNETLQDVLKAAEESALPTHNHPDGIKGAKAIAACIYMARKGCTKEQIKDYIIQNEYGYNLNINFASVLMDTKFDISCNDIVPLAIYAFLESKDFESSIRLASLLSNDTDTIAAITGSIAEAFYGGIPETWLPAVTYYLDVFLLATVKKFNKKYLKQLNYKL